MAKKIAIFNQKGGVGKTTTTANLCACLSMLNKKVLAIDADPQNNLTSGLDIRKENFDHDLYSVLLDGEDPNKAIMKTKYKNLDIIPSSMDLAGAEVELSEAPNRELKLKKAVEKINQEGYDYIIMDCPPSLGLLPINVLASVDSVIIPIQCEYYALEGVSQLVNTINLVKKSLNPTLEIEGVLLTMFDSRTNLSVQVVEEVKSYFGMSVFNTVIPRNVRLAEAPSYGMTIVEYDKHSKGAVAYIELAKELIMKRVV